MRKITVYNFVSLDGYFTGPNGEIDWFKSIKKDEEYDRETHEQAGPGGILLFGRTTYEMMKRHWPKPEAIKSDPGMAEAVNESEKLVISSTLNGAQEEREWKGVKVLPEMTKENMSEIKGQKGKDITILGSGSIVRQMTNWGLIDEYQLMVVPVVLGAGKSMFEEVKNTELKLLGAKTYKNGIVALRYGAVQGVPEPNVIPK